MAVISRAVPLRFSARGKIKNISPLMFYKKIFGAPFKQFKPCAQGTCPLGSPPRHGSGYQRETIFDSVCSCFHVYNR